MLGGPRALIIPISDRPHRRHLGAWAAGQTSETSGGRSPPTPPRASRAGATVTVPSAGCRVQHVVLLCIVRYTLYVAIRCCFFLLQAAQVCRLGPVCTKVPHPYLPARCILHPPACSRTAAAAQQRSSRTPKKVQLDAADLGTALPIHTVCGPPPTVHGSTVHKPKPTLGTPKSR